jgi:hypothetical protein
MCLNCGCGLPHDSHGKPENITADSLRRAGDANGQSMRESARHIIEAVERLEGGGREDDRDGGATPGTAPAGLAEPAGRQGAEGGGRGTPASES